MRCKYCHLTFQARQKATAAAVPVAIPVSPPSSAIQAPVAKPVASPVRGEYLVAGRPGQVQGAAPASSPFAFDTIPASVPANNDPFRFSHDGTQGGTDLLATRVPSRRRKGGGWWKGVLIGGCVLGITAVVMAFFGRHILGLVGDPSTKKKNEKPLASDREIEPPKKTRKEKTILVKNKQRDKDRREKQDKKPTDREKRPEKPPKKTLPEKDKKTTDNSRPKKDKDGVKVPDPTRDKSAKKDSTDPARDSTKPNKDVDKPKDKTPPNKDVDKPKDKTPPNKDGDKPKDKTPPNKDGDKPKDKTVVKRPKPPGTEYFPRRALAISVCNYLYANPLSYGGDSASTAGVLSAFNRYLHFPATQLVELSDGANPAKARPTLKPVVERTISDFLAVSRAMDRVLVLFSGHAVVLNKEIYLVPMEGDLTNARSLVKVSWVYEQLVKCPARQKVLVLDVARLDPSRGQERQSPGPMSAEMDALLKKHPAGIQVWTSCVAKQQSYDFYGGSLFLEAVAAVLREKAVRGIQEPTDPLPLPLLQEKVAAYIAARAKNEKVEQTPRLLGKDPGKGADYDPDQELPPAQVIQLPPGLKEGTASRGEIQGILDEIETIPPAKGAVNSVAERLKFEVLPPFPAKGMAAYKADYRSLQELDERLKDSPDKYKLIRAIRKATQVLEKNSDSFVQTQGGRAVPLPVAEKNRIMNYQADTVGPAIARLEDALKDLKKVGEERDKEPSKRWQANYDYVLAKLINRVVYLREYSLMLGKLRKDEVPKLGPGHIGWRLASVPKLTSTDAEIKELTADAKEALKNLIKEHKNTPWEVLARREGGVYLGLKWMPNNR
jgi:hypothetical protein